MNDMCIMPKREETTIIEPIQHNELRAGVILKTKIGLEVLDNRNIVISHQSNNIEYIQDFQI